MYSGSPWWSTTSSTGASLPLVERVEYIKSRYNDWPLLSNIAFDIAVAAEDHRPRPEPGWLWLYEDKVFKSADAVLNTTKLVPVPERLHSPHALVFCGLNKTAAENLYYGWLSEQSDTSKRFYGKSLQPFILDWFVNGPGHAPWMAAVDFAKLAHILPRHKRWRKEQEEKQHRYEMEVYSKMVHFFKMQYRSLEVMDNQIRMRAGVEQVD